MRATKSWLVLVLVASFWTNHKAVPGFFRHSIENCSNGITEGDPFFSSCPCAISVIMSSLHVRTRSTERPSRSICSHSLLEGMSLKYLKDAYSSSVIKQPIGTNCLIVVRDNGNSFRGFSVLHCASCTAHKNPIIRQISALTPRTRYYFLINDWGKEEQSSSALEWARRLIFYFVTLVYKLSPYKL